MDFYISDLDGTLLNSKKEISEFSKIEINKLIREKGLNFTIATARTPGTVVEMLEGLEVNFAVALMNGVLLYDLNKKKYLKIRSIENNIVRKILNILETFNKDSFVYGVNENHLYVYHKELVLDLDEIFYKERCNSEYKTFKKVKTYDEALNNLDVVNFMILDKLEIIKLIYEELKNIEGINVNYYKDIYNEECYFIEIHSLNASKAEAINDLKELYNLNKAICFGDNLNDLPMFEIADEAYAMGNAVPALKEVADGIILSNDKDGVAKYLIEKFTK